MKKFQILEKTQKCVLLVSWPFVALVIQSLPFKITSYRNDIFGFLVNSPVIIFRPLNIIFDSMCKEFFRGFTKKWNTANEKLIENDTHAPPIHGFTIALSEYHFRCNIFRSSEYLWKELLACLRKFTDSLIIDYI